MIGLALRLTLRGGREAAARLAIIAGAVGLGVGLLLMSLAGINAVNSQNARYAWLDTAAGAAGNPEQTPSHASAARFAATDALWWRLTADEFHGQVIGRVDVAATGTQSPVPPGIPSLPGPGQFYASPALSELLRSTPADQLWDRYPGRQIGTIGPAALPAPNSLIIVIGHTPAQMSQLGDATEVTAIATTSPSSCNGPTCLAIGIDADGMDLVLSVVAAALLFPILIFIATATRLSAARREQRFAAMRLVGATPHQVAMISAVESTVAAAAGVIVGFGLFYALRSLLAPIPFTGAPFFLHDLVLNPADILVVVLGVPLAAAVVSRLALRRTIISPLGVTRRVTPRSPRAWRLVPLTAGLAELGWFALAGRPASTAAQIQAFMAGILLTMAGLVIAGPWLTMVASRLMASHATRPASLIASRRLSDNPHAGFRAISGLALALFAVSLGFAVITTMDANYGGPTTDAAADHATVLARLADRFTPQSAKPPSSISAPVMEELQAIPGVRTVIAIHEAPAETNPLGPQQQDGSRPLPPPRGVVSCAQLSATPALGRCPAGAETATISPELIGSKYAPSLLAAATISPQQLQSLPVITLAVATDGSHPAIERVRTVLEGAYPSRQSPVTIAENNAQTAGAKNQAAYQRLADVGILASLPIAGCTLAVSIVAGLNDRKRPFSLLRLTGAPLHTLRQAITYETVVPLVATAIVASATAFLAAYLFLRSQLDETLRPPGAEYFGLVAAGLVVALTLMASTLPLLERITGPETARNE